MHPCDLTSACQAAPTAHVVAIEELLRDWLTVRRYDIVVDADGQLGQSVARLSADRGDRVAVLPYSTVTGTVVLTRQLRVVTDMSSARCTRLVEVPGGLLDGEPPDNAVMRETFEETGLVLTSVRRLFSAYMAPQVTTERTILFVAEYESSASLGQRSPGLDDEEDICLFESGLDEAIDLVLHEQPADAKTLLLLIYARATDLVPIQQIGNEPLTLNPQQTRLFAATRGDPRER
jgi:GDP-mannose pyrophosphatase NudK